MNFNLSTDQATALFLTGLVVITLLLIPVARELVRLADSVETLCTKQGPGEIFQGDQVQYVGKDPMLHGFYTVSNVEHTPGMVLAIFTGYSKEKQHLPTTVKELPICDIRIHRNGCLLTPVQGAS